MDDDNRTDANATTETVTDTGGATDSTGPEQSGSTGLSAAELDAIVASKVQERLDKLLPKERAKARRQAEKELGAQRDASTPEQAVAKPPAEGDDRFDKLYAVVEKLTERQAAKDAEEAFGKAIAGKQISDKQREALKSMYDPNNDAAFQALLEQFPGADAATNGNGDGFVSPGGPSGPSPESLSLDMTKWSREFIEAAKSDGTFRAKIEAYRASLPGGSNNLFRRKIPTK